MASERKPSIYSDRGTIGSSDELDEYGVWVKSEPQDLSSVNAENQEPAEPPIPAIEELPDFDIDFDEGGDLSGPNEAVAEDFDESGLDFDDPSLEIPDLDIPEESVPPDADSLDADLSDIDSLDADLPDAGGAEILDLDDLSIPEEKAESSDDEEGFTEIAIEDFLGAPSDNFEESGLTSVMEEPVSETQETPAADLSTQLLIKIADELSSIRTELSTLKQEFSAVRGEVSGDDKSEAQKKGFFDEEEDEKIALTGDELDNILNTADFTEEAGADATEELDDGFSSPEAGESDTSGFFPVDEEPPLPDMLSDQADIIGEEPKNDEIPQSPEDVDIELSLDQPDLDELASDNAIEESASGNNDISFDSQEFDIDLEPGPATEEAPEMTMELDDSEELRQLREEGAQPLTPAPEDTSYLDTEPASQEAGDFPLEPVTLDDASLDEPVIDLSDAVIDEPDLSGGIMENPLEEPLLEDISLEDIPEDISIDLDMEDENTAPSLDSVPAEDAAFPEEELELSIPEEPVDETGETPVRESAAPEEESFAQVIPEGFVVEADDSQVPFDDDPEEEAALSEGDIDTLEQSPDFAEEPDSMAEEIEESTDLSEDEELDIPSNIKQELRTVLSYMDQLLESLPEDKIEEFAKSEYFDTYKKLFKELGLV